MSLDLTRNSLVSMIEFDVPFTITEYGSIHFPRNVWGPSVYWAELTDGTSGPLIDGQGWGYVDGFSGQYRYSGPVMHPSEFLGGRMAQYVIDTPGTYVLTTVYPLGDDDSDPDGWVLLRMEDES